MLVDVSLIPIVSVFKKYRKIKYKYGGKPKSSLDYMSVLKIGQDVICHYSIDWNGLAISIKGRNVHRYENRFSRYITGSMHDLETIYLEMTNVRVRLR